MSRNPIISVINRSHWTKEEKKKREELEKHIQAPNDRLTPPDYLTERAKQKYNQLCWEMPWLDNLDHQDLVIYCFCWDRCESLMEALQVQPDSLVVGKKMLPNQNRYALKNYTEELRKISSKLGIAHIDRLKLLQPKEEEKPVNKFTALKQKRLNG